MNTAYPTVRRILQWAAISFVILLTLAAVLFHPFENWRGRRAWRQYKQELAARGEHLDWEHFIPATIPDDQNIFEAPKMTAWFSGTDENELTALLSARALRAFARNHANARSAMQVDLILRSGTNDGGTYDAVLRTHLRSGAVFVSVQTTNTSFPILAEWNSQIIPLIVVENVSVIDAIRNLARQAEMKYSLDPEIVRRVEARLFPGLTARWEDVTAQEALHDVLEHFNLQWTFDPESRVVHFAMKAQETGFPDPGREIGRLILQALGRSVEAPQGFFLVAGPVAKKIRPLRILLRGTGARPFDTASIQRLFPTNAVAVDRDSLQIETTGLNSFRMTWGALDIHTAADYLAWTDQFKPRFDLIREALKRPGARLHGPYERPEAIPLLNIKAVRRVSQTLAQRAQAFLLLERPDEALRELTLLHAMHRLRAAGPTNLTSTLAGASAVKTYVDAVAEGLRLKAWRDSHLATLQGQLEEINLLPSLANALRGERACLLRMNRDGMAEKLSYPDGPTLLRRAPPGWLLHHHAHIAERLSKTIDCLNLANSIVLTEQLDRPMRSRLPLSSLFTSVSIPDYRLSFTIVTHHQTLANQALVACAIERHRLARGCYPENLETLTPQFIAELPHDLVGGQPLKYSRAGRETFKLYSVGWNGSDDGGFPAKRKNHETALINSDWVWLAK